MNDFNHSSTFTAPLGASVHHRAEQFSKQHGDRQKVQQVYLNTLAVYAVQFYLRCMDIETEQDTSDSWDAVMQALMDVADLTIPGVGKVECRPMLPNKSVMQIPPEVCSDRIGYFAVELEPSLRTAAVLGFAPSAGNGEIPIHQLRSLDDFLKHLQHLQSRVSLSQWLQAVFSAGWRSLEEVIGNDQHLAFSLRSDAQVEDVAIARAKLFDLGLQLGSQSVVLLVAITPDAEQQLGILVQVHPAEKTTLPPNLMLSLLSETEGSLQAVRSRSQDNYIQLRRFWGSPGERFKIQLMLNGVSITESFEI